MPEIAVAPWGFREMPQTEFFECVADLGLSHVEVSLSRGAPLHLMPDAPQADFESTLEAAAQCGLRVACVAASCEFASLDPVDLDEAIRVAENHVDFAKALGAPVVRFFTGLLSANEVPDAFYTSLQYALNRVGDYAAGRGVTVAIENHGGPTRDGETIARMMEGVDSPGIGLLYDPANFTKIGVDALFALRRIAPWVRYVHLKDVVWNGQDTEYCAFGEGDIHWPPIIRELRQAYDGVWSLEYEAPADVRDGTRRSLENLRAMLE